MSNKAFPNPYSTSKTVGAQAGQSNRGLVVNIMDPKKSGRVQIRVVGHHDDEQRIPDDKLPWVKVRNSTTTPSLQTATATHGLLPGSMITCEAMGEGGQDWLITGTIPNDRKDDQQAIHPATQGKGDTDNSHTNDQRSKVGDGTYAWHRPLNEVVESKTTKEARKQRDSAGRKSRRSGEPIAEARDKSGIPQTYGNRTTSKDPKGGTIGVFKFQGKDPQAFIQQTIQNASSVVPNALSALQSLKKVNGNPTSIQSIGSGNFSQIMSQLSSWFKSNGNKEEQQKFDCGYLLSIAEDLLPSEELKQARKVCEIVETQIQGLIK